MNPRLRLNVTSMLLTGTALLTTAALPSGAVAAASFDGSFQMAQAQQQQAAPPEQPAAKPQAPAAKPAPPAAKPPAAPPPPRPAAPPPPQRPAAPPPPQPRVQAPPPPAAPAQAPAQRAQPQQAPAAAPREERRPPPPAAQERREERPAAQERREERRPGAPPQAPAAQRPAAPAPAQAPAAAQPQAAPPAAQQPAARPQPPAAGQERRDERRDDRREGRPDDRRGPQTPPTAQQPQAPAAPTAQQPQRGAPSAVAPGGNPAAVQAPQVRNANEFIRRDGQAPSRGIQQLRQERQETRDGNRVFIREGDRTIIREDNRTIIRHNESGRFAIGARNVVTERRGANSETIVERGDGIRIVSVSDPEGRLLRRYRRDRDGREVVIIDNSFAFRRGPVPIFVQLPPPRIGIPRERYILDADRAGPADIYGVLSEGPVEVLDQPYTLDQVRFSAPLRDRMPRVDLDINFELGSWQLSPEQVDRLSVVAEAINRALQRNPAEVFMIEGHTDATGTPEDNLSLSDRRAESVAVALTEQFRVPAENLVTQGYGEQYLKVQTDAPDRVNRRVAVRRITPLIDQQANAGGAPPPPPPR